VLKNKTPQNQMIKRGLSTRGGTTNLGFTQPHQFTVVFESIDLIDLIEIVKPNAK
jgi:hypothetical protein